MRNLKRVLSLALATVMLLGMMVIGAGAADAKKEAVKASDLTDMATVVHKEAVNLLVDLKVIEGKPDKTYDPKGIVDRATMAKLITLVLMGDVDPALFEGTATDLKDIDKSWANGYIKYCYSNNIIAGDGLGSFFPSKTVTAAEASKMLLVALGYDAKGQGYTGGSWSVNAIKDAQKAGLLKGVEANANEGLSRDSAAQMIYNALFAKTVKNTYGYDMNGNKYVSGSTANSTTLGQETYKLFKATATVTGFNADGTVQLTSVVPASAPKLTAAINGAKYACDANMVGNKISVYYKAEYDAKGDPDFTNTTTVKMVSSVPVVSSAAILATSKDGTGMDKLTKKTDKKFLAELDTPVSYFKNGTPVADVNAEAAKAGVIIDFIDNDGDGLADVVKATQKTVATLTGDPSTKEVTGKDTQVKIPGIIGAFSTANTVKTVVGYEGLKKDDVVLYVQVGTITTIEKLTPVAGQMTAKTSDTSPKIVFGGTKYSESGLVSATSVNAFADFNKDALLYLDDNGTAVKLMLAPGQKSETNYAVLIDYAYVVGSGVSGSSYGEAKLLKNDATTEVVKVSKIDIDGFDGNGANTNGLIAIVAGTVDEASKAGFIGNDNNGKFFSYTIDSDGKYELTKVVNSHSSVADSKKIVVTTETSKTVTPNQAAFAPGYAGNSNTIFLTGKTTGGKTTYALTTGVANAPRFTTTGAAFEALTIGGMSKIIYITNGEASVGGAAQQTVYFLNTKYTEYPAVTGGLAKHREYSAIVDGKVTPVKIADGAYSNVAVGLKAVTYTGDLVTTIAAVTAPTAPATGAGVAAAANDVVKLATTYYTYTSDMVVYTIDGSNVTVGGIESLVADDNDSFVATFEGASAPKNTTITAIYVTKTDVVTSLNALALDNSLTVASFVPGTTEYTVDVAKSKVASSAMTVVATGTVTDDKCTATGTSVTIPKAAAVASTYTVTVTVTLKDGVNETNPGSTVYTVTLKIVE